MDGLGDVGPAVGGFRASSGTAMTIGPSSILPEYVPAWAEVSVGQPDGGLLRAFTAPLFAVEASAAVADDVRLMFIERLPQASGGEGGPR